ncbi:metal-dependent hydrolase [Natronolimnobius sp. AArcel1]|uniref:metal-dependent hydrolase n=1 Tax=Natronolimnobius sp. AArcel1 TaxID=1679093 RepID=UPI0013EDB1B1|nr:metal-dependent hydrolase [Natronolimnobius sp. AArcel1]NGM69542.1 metal-dependent hydrolase [Natronolimnobius sp. AArcel1]
MAELLSHVLIAYTLATIASWRLEWLTRRWVAIAMIGALIPDVNRVGLFVSDATLERLVGVPVSVDAIHTLGGVVVLSGIGAMVLSAHQRRAFGVLLAGALSHLLVDGLKAYADGAADAWLYPLTWYRHPTPNLYVSSDPTVLVVTVVGALAVVVCDRILRERGLVATS